MPDTEQLKIAWESIKERAKPHVASISYDLYIKPLFPYDFKDEIIILKVLTDNMANLINSQYGEILKKAIAEANVGIRGYRFYVPDSEIFTLEEYVDDFPSVPIRSEYTFESFVVGSSNKFVYAAAKAVAQNPGDGLNPLFIYGESGLGKTHLMQAIANYLQKEKPEKRVLYTTCENFLNEFIDATARGNFASRDRGAKFRQHYRNVDVLMIDDIQFLAKKPGLQEEFFHTFNELSGQNKQIVLTSDRPPKEIATLEERLRTRFEGGLITDVQPPDPETKLAILKRKSWEKKCPVSEEVLEFLANDSGHDVRTLEGRLTKVIFASKLHEEPITLELAMKALKESIPTQEAESEKVDADTIISAVCSYYKFNKADILGKSKKSELVKARQICAYLICEILSMPLVATGKILGGRDHTTIMYARDKVEELCKFNSKIAKEVDDIKNAVYKK